MSINPRYTIIKEYDGKKLWDNREKVDEARKRGSRGLKNRVKFCNTCGKCIKLCQFQVHSKICKK